MNAGMETVATNAPGMVVHALREAANTAEFGKGEVVGAGFAWQCGRKEIESQKSGGPR
jgi:hypothetical protein